uniref:Mitogen-activated protein kinase-binding protein 1-like n=1 Tax=Cynoglossus semilaevis TaxID=244447 RepID=A0A3P8UIG2_CYNSE
MPAEGFTIKSRIRNLLRSPSAKQKIRSEKFCSKVTLEKVLGITALGNSGLTCDPRSGLLAYPAGCVVVLLNPKKNRQQHIINSSRKTITALSFSPDGKYLVTGESGHQPAVRLWDVAERRQVAEIQKHKYGISCVAFSPNGKYIVSVGNQHDMMVNVWAWKKDVVVATNKVSCKVTGVSFSEDSSYFVTVGYRHVKFWYLDNCKINKSNAPVPLLGRAGLLGELRNNFFCDVACGRGPKYDSTFCITSSGLLCEFNSKRMLEQWVDLRTNLAQSLTLSEDLIFCGCADGTVRAFRLTDLHFVCTLPRPHPLGTDVSALSEASQRFSTKADVRYPAAVAVTYDPINHWLSCVYNDHSLYVWDVRDVSEVEKVHSALFHGGCVWDLEVFPDVPGEMESGLSSGTFLSCSADDTIRFWHIEDCLQPRVHFQNVLSGDLLNIIYIDGNTAALLDPECMTNVSADKSGDGQMTGVRTLCISPDGKHLATGDRNGMLRVHDLNSLEEILKAEAHDAEILCLEYSKPETGLKLLATASRDRLIHVLDAEDDYSLLQTLDEHSSSITAVRFAANENTVRLISCGADKSVYFHTAHKTVRGTMFRRSHHMARKTTLYDMSIDPTCKYAAVGCQDRFIRIFNISSGKQKKVYKGSVSEDGSLLRVEIDPSGQYVATSCSDKSISIFDFYTGECIATMIGHSEVVTGMKFTNDCKRLISVSGDSCIFVWRLAPELTMSMRERLCQLRQNTHAPSNKTFSLRREVHSAPTLRGLSTDSDHELQEEDETENSDLCDLDDITATSSSDSSRDEDSGDSDEGQNWQLTKVNSEPGRRPRRRWSHRVGLMVKSMLDLRQLEAFSHRKNHQERQSSSSLQEPVQPLEERSRRHQPWPHSGWLSSHPSKGIRGNHGVVLYPEDNERRTCLRGSDYTLKEQNCWMEGRRLRSERRDGNARCGVWSQGYDDSADMELLSQDGSDEDREEVKQNAAVTSMDEALRTVNGTAEPSQEHFLKHNLETLADGCSTAEQTTVSRHTMSSRFLTKAHDDRSSLTYKLPVSKVRPLMDKDHGTNDEDLTSTTTVRTEGQNGPRAMEDSCSPVLRAKKMSSKPHLWRLSSPPHAASLNRTTCLTKSLSAQDLASDSLYSPALSTDRRDLQKRPQHHTSHVSSPSCSSPRSPRSPPPWDRPQHSYMNPTASSMAKSSRSSSLCEGIHTATPPCSPHAVKSRRSSVELEVELPLFSSSPVAAHPPPLSPSSSIFSPQSKSSSPAMTVSPTPFTNNVPPSRIPIPTQPLSPRCGVCLAPNGSGGLTRVFTPIKAPSQCDLSHKQGQFNFVRKYTNLKNHIHIFVSSELFSSSGRSRLPSLICDPSLPSSEPVKWRRDSFSQSVSEPGPLAVDKECPLVSEQVHTAEPLPDPFITLETCKQTITELHNSLKEAITLYTTCGQHPTKDQQQMRTILSEALFSVKTELDSLSPLSSQCETSPVTQVIKGDGDKALALLEQYAELLLKSVEKRLDNKS